MKKLVLLAALLLLPSSAFSAGFAKQSLFLSQTSVTESETVLIHAVVNNDTPGTFAGVMVFTEGAKSIGTVPVSLNAGEAGAVSVSWKPAAGSHTITAELRKDGVFVEKQSATFTVAAKPVPVATNQSQSAAAVESSEGIQESIASLSPGAAEAAKPAFTLIDGGRSQLSEIVDGQIAAAKTNLGPRAGAVLGAETVTQAKADPMGTFWAILWTVYLYLLTVVKFIIGNAGVFYPVLAFLILLSLWRLFNRFRRPAY